MTVPAGEAASVRPGAAAWRRPSWRLERVPAGGGVELTALLRDLVEDPAHRRAFAERVANHDSEVWVALPADSDSASRSQPGCTRTSSGAVGLLLAETACARLQILLLAVSARVRGMGVGRALVREAILWAIDADLDAVELEVRESNDRAQALYESLGFVAAALRPRYYPDGDQAVVMAVSLVNLPV